MQMSSSALLAADCYVTREIRDFLIVVTAAVLHNYRLCSLHNECDHEQGLLFSSVKSSTDWIRFTANLNPTCNSPSGCAV